MIDALPAPTPNVDISGGTVVIGGNVVGGAPSQPSVAQRLQELETLRATGVISDAESTAKREQVIGEI